MSYNKFGVKGTLVRDVEMSYTTTGVPLAKGAIAVNRNTKGEDGNYETDFFNFVAWRHTAEFLNNNMRKGAVVILSGRMQQRKWVDQQSGQNRSVVELVVDDVDVCKWPADREEGDEEADSFADAPAPQPAPQAQARPARRAEPQPAPVEEYDDDEVDPFASEDEDTVPVQTEKPQRRQPVGAR